MEATPTDIRTRRGTQQPEENRGIEATPTDIRTRLGTQQAENTNEEQQSYGWDIARAFIWYVFFPAGTLASWGAIIYGLIRLIKH